MGIDMARTTASELAERLTDDGHTVEISDNFPVVRITDQDGRIGLSDMPLGWKLAAVLDDGEIHLVQQ